VSLDAALTAAVFAEVQRQIADLRRPELVTQRTVAAVVGMPERDYLRHVRARDWPSWADRRLRYSRTDDVVAWIAAHPVTSGATVRALRGTSEFARSRSGLRRVAS
jgi:hypothetical protein